MARAAAAVVTVVDVEPIVGALARWWNKTIRHLGRHHITPPVYINFCYWTAAMVLMWGDSSRAQEDGGRADDPTTVTTAEDDGGGVDEKEEASSTAGSDNARLAKAMEHWFLVGLAGLLVLALLGCCMLNIYHESSKLQKHRRSKNLAALRSNEETRNWSSTLEARKRQFGFTLTNGASDGVHHQRDKYFVEAFDYPRIISGVHLSSDIDDLSIVERSLSLTSVASRGGSGYDLGGNSSSSNNNSNNNSKKEKTSTMRSHSGGAFNYPRFTTGVHPGSGINDLSIVERSMSLSSVAQRGGSAYGFGSFSSSNNRKKSINTVGLGPNLSHTIFEGDELQGKKAPGEKGYVYRNPLARQHAGSEGVLGTPRRHVAL